VAQHFKLDLDVRAILLREKLSKLGLNFSLLIQQLPDSRVQGRVIRRRHEQGGRWRRRIVAVQAPRRRQRRRWLAGHGWRSRLAATEREHRNALACAAVVALWEKRWTARRAVMSRRSNRDRPEPPGSATIRTV